MARADASVKAGGWRKEFPGARVEVAGPHGGHGRLRARRRGVRPAALRVRLPPGGVRPVRLRRRPLRARRLAGVHPGRRLPGGGLRGRAGPAVAGHRAVRRRRAVRADEAGRLLRQRVPQPAGRHGRALRGPGGRGGRRARRLRRGAAAAGQPLAHAGQPDRDHPFRRRHGQRTRWPRWWPTRSRSTPRPAGSRRRSTRRRWGGGELPPGRRRRPDRDQGGAVRPDRRRGRRGPGRPWPPRRGRAGRSGT